jgi:hypothetical protein
VLVAVSVVSANIKETHERWKLETFFQEGQTVLSVDDPRFPAEMRRRLTEVQWPKESYRVLDGGDTDFGPAFTDTSAFGGLMYVVDTDTGEEVWRSDWGDYIATPSGFCFDGDSMFVLDLEGSNIFDVDMRWQPGRLLRRISNPALNDAHYLVRTRRGLLVASTGVDMAVEMDLDGRTLFEWWAGDYGFTSTRNGLNRVPEKERDHRGQYYHTRYQTTHLNAARYRDASETRMLILLWDQGALVEIDTTLPRGKQEPRVVLDGLAHPHSVRPLGDGGWLIADSQGESLVVLDEDLRLRQRIPSVTGWIQDAMSLGPNRWLVADVNRFRLLIQDDEGTELAEIPFNRDWRVYGLEAVPRALASSFSSASRLIGRGARSAR